MTAITSPISLSRPDLSMCQHLKQLVSLPSTAIESVQIKQEPGTEEGKSVASSSTGGQQDIHPPANSQSASIRQRYANIIRWGAREEGAKRRRLSAPHCTDCHAVLFRPWACLTCPAIGCMALRASTVSGKTCIRDHCQGQQQTCGFAVDPTSGGIYCGACDDVTYSDSFEALFRATKVEVEELGDTSREVSIIGKGRSRGMYKPWSASDIAQDTQVVSMPCRGLRPLLNLSQTCFLSAVLQALIHNPLLKAYFLSDKHNRHVCANGTKGLGAGRPFLGPDGTVSSEREKGCMCCEMDRAFEEFHSDERSPFGPITMLYSMWHASAELEGYGQQDAHSFFLAALEQIHAHAKGQLSSCNCIAHQTFSGALSSSVTCSKCKTTSTTVDPILDLQLDFPTDPTDASALTLTSMLRRFCAAEKVGDATKGYDCSKCGGGPGVVASRKLAIKKLPPVLSFQLKRFAHTATSTKVELPVRFPASLDMTPFVDPPLTDSKPLPVSLYHYDLFAVVTHEGKLDNGHYWADVLSGDEWWHCDDDKVTPTALKDVLSQKAYMLFYVKRSLAYAQPVSKPSTNGAGESETVRSAIDTADQPLPAAEKTSINPISGRIGHSIGGMAV